ncbi:winged helix-turn-helix domain-containing protein [Vallitalea maricola]|uniref:Uncharacterized protein n=1 Tax=Vallitalea maricola TaxID=3074433 RepID=A0ACB5UHW3_9FIRM|nr:hypothetical protein AN2V17_16790 [Vallitalea sp. AN17-2]
MPEPLPPENGESLWGYENAPEGSNLTSFIFKLRNKIEPSPDNPQYIVTVWGSARIQRRKTVDYNFTN